MRFLHALLPHAVLKSLTRILFFVVGAAALIARDDVPTVGYKPSLKLIEGDQPLLTSYVLEITSPYNVAANSNLTITPVLSATTVPEGISNATALSFVTFSASTLTFTGPNQKQNLTVTVSVPAGAAAGSFVWQIATVGWAPGTLDPRAAINAKITIPQTPAAPAIAISSPLDNTVFSQPYNLLPLSIPVTFAATAPAVSPISSIDADINGTAIILTSTGLGTSAVEASGSIPVSVPGIFTIRARATNNVGTSTDTVEVTVNVIAPAPTVVVNTPTQSTFTYSGSALNIPFSFTATSVFGNFTSLAATLNGTPVTVTPDGLGSLLATGSGSLAVNSAGTYTLVVTATSPYGTASATKTFNVAAAQTVNPPVVTISQPLAGATFSRVAGSPATSIPFAFSAVADAGRTISSITGSLNGNSVVVNASGLDTGTANGTGNLSVSAPGTYTFVAGATQGTLSGSKSVTFTVTESPAPAADCRVLWLPPISLGKVQKGGSGIPIKFTLDCQCGPCGHDRDDGCDRGNRHGWGRDDGGHVASHNRGDDDDGCANERDTSVVVFIYEILSDGNTTEPAVFTYSRHGKKSRRDSTYEIDGNHYHLNFDTDRGTHRYHIDVYRTVAGSTTPQLLGTKEFTTR